MTRSTSGTAGHPSASGHVEAYCSTGSSPGNTASDVLSTRLPFDLGPPSDVRIRFEVQGPPTAPPVVVLGGISAHGHLAPTPDHPAPGWWPGVVGVGGALSPRDLRLVGVDYLAGPEVPVASSAAVTTADQARAVLAVLDHLGIRRASFVGASYGGMVALAAALAAPHRVATLTLLCAAHRSHPMATAVRALQRRVARLGATSGREAEGLSLARGLAMTSYRSAEEFEDRFPRTWELDGERRPRFAVETYLEARGEAFAARFPTDAFVRLSESIDLHDVDPSPLTVPAVLASWDSDVLVPPWLVEELRERAAAPCRHVRLSSPFGHDAFLKERRQVSELLRDALSPEVVR